MSTSIIFSPVGSAGGASSSPSATSSLSASSPSASSPSASSPSSASSASSSSGASTCSIVDSTVRLSKARSEEHTSELQSRGHLVCRLLLEKKNKGINSTGYKE